MESPPRKRPSLKRLLLVNLLVLLAGLLLLEACLTGPRLPIYPEVEYLADLDVVVNRPNLRQSVKAQRRGPEGGWQQYTYQILTDADGCRVGSSPPPSRDRAVAVVGDSFSFGCDADYEECLSGRLQATCADVQVYNFAVRGTCSRDYPNTLDYYWRRKASRGGGGVRLAAVVVGLYVDPVFGDLPRLIARRHFGSYKSMDGYSVSPSRFARLSGSDGSRALFHGEVWLRRHSALFNRLFPRGADTEFATPLPPTLSEDQVRQGLDMVVGNLEALGQASGLPASRIVVHLIPTPREVIAALEGSPPAPAQQLWDRIGQAARDKGFRVVDPREDYVRRLKSKEAWPFSPDFHSTPAGFEWMSQPIEKELTQALAEDRP